MKDEFAPASARIHTYKIDGDARLSIDMPQVLSFLHQVDEVNPISIKVHGYIGEKCKFKFKGTESQLRDLLSIMGSDLEFKVKTVRKTLF